MAGNMKKYVEDVLEIIKKKDWNQPEFMNTAKEVLYSIIPVLEQHPEYKQNKLLERFVEPERVVIFRVPWADDKGELQVNRGFRVQMSSAIGPYKGGLRFHPSVNLSIAFRASHWRRQGRFRLRSERQVRRRGHALLPELHDGALPPYRRGC